MRRLAIILAPILIVCGLVMHFRGCAWSGNDKFQPLPPDRETTTTNAPSKFPVAVDPAQVGTYPWAVKSGAGYFYDEVLEYRVWIHPQQGGARLNEGNVYFRAFATYENAKQFSEFTKGAEEPLVLIRQLEYVNEPQVGVFEHVTEVRLTEWKVEWLKNSKRGPTSISDFLAAHKKQ